MRSHASLDSKISFVTNSTDTLTYLDEKTGDAKGRIWLSVENEQGKTGWISSKVVEIETE